MSPQEKAEELCRKMLFQIEWNAQPSTVKGIAKECALICCNEVLNNLEDHTGEDIAYWEEVKQEIKLLV